MAGKVRRVDFYPDEYISGVGGVLRADEQGIYWMICALIISEGGPIPRNETRFASLCLVRPADVRRILDKLLEMGKISLTGDGKLSQKRAQSEVELSSKRIQIAAENGAKGGRPSKKTGGNQQNVKADGLFPEKLTTNYQLPTTNEEDKKEGSTSLRSVAPSAPKPKGTRLSDAWVLPKTYGAWALEKGLPRERIQIEADKIRNWSINAGKTGVKVDWFAAWRNWVQKAIDELPRERGSPKGPTAGDIFGELSRKYREEADNEQRAEQRNHGFVEADFRVLSAPAKR